MSIRAVDDDVNSVLDRLHYVRAAVSYIDNGDQWTMTLTVTTELCEFFKVKYRIARITRRLSVEHLHSTSRTTAD
jgi:hypothetical protein